MRLLDPSFASRCSPICTPILRQSEVLDVTKKLTFSPSNFEILRAGRINDPQTPGLFVEASSTGKKTFRYQRRVRGITKPHKATLGTTTGYTMIEAREWARAFNIMIDRGIDPTEQKKADAKAAMTVADAHAIYMAAVERGTHRTKQKAIRESSIGAKRDIWRVDIKPHLGSRELASLTGDDLWEVIERKGLTAPVRANRLAAELKVFFKFCCSRAGREIGLRADPSSTLMGKYFEEKPRTRVLSSDEIVLFLKALATEPRHIRRPLLLALLTGCRFEEVLAARRDELVNGIWKLADERVKNDKAHLVPLGPWARSMFTVNTDYLFPARRADGPMLCGWSKVFTRIVAKMAVARFSMHDLRRTFSTNVESWLTPSAVVEALLNHKKKELKRQYNQYEYLEDKRAVLARWEAQLVEVARKTGTAEALDFPA